MSQFQPIIDIQQGGPIFHFFKRSRKSGLFHEIAPFLNVTKIHKPLCGHTEICLQVTIRWQPSLSSCSLVSTSARPFDASLPSQFSLLRMAFAASWPEQTSGPSRRDSHLTFSLEPSWSPHAEPSQRTQSTLYILMLRHSSHWLTLLTNSSTSCPVPRIILCPRS